MSDTVELELERQVLRAGEKIEGVLLVNGIARYEWIKVELHGEEVLGANSTAYSVVYPVVEQVLRVAEKGEATSPQRFPIEFELPEDCPPSYASRELRCHYFLKIQVRRGGWHRDVVKRIPLTLLPAEALMASTTPRELLVQEGPLTLTVRLDFAGLMTGESLTGSLVLDQTEEGAALPSKLTFRFAAIEESTSRAFSHREVLWLVTHDVEPEDDATLPLTGVFEFPVAEDAPFSGTWNGFRLHYGFRVGMFLANGKDARESLPIRVYRRYTPIPS